MHKRHTAVLLEKQFMTWQVYDYVWLARLCVQHEPNITGDNELQPHVEEKKGQIIQ